MKIKNVIMTALVTGMLLTGTVGSVYSYFTTNAEATGSASILWEAERKWKKIFQLGRNAWQLLLKKTLSR